MIIDGVPWGKALDPVAAKWRELFEQSVEPFKDLPNLLSGGVDSGTIFAAQLALGGKFVAYAFRLGDYDQPDVQVAKKMCADFDVPIVVVEIERSEEALVRDIFTVMELLDTSRKASIQCAQPIMHLAERISADGYDRAIVGTGAVCLDDKRVAILVAQRGEEVAREYRREKLTDRYTDCGTGRMHEIARLRGVTLEEPYSDEPIVAHALALDYWELNRPKQKGIALRAYPHFWNRGYYRRNSPLQVNSGVREWHDSLLLTRWNRRGKRSVVAIYNDMLKEVRHARNVGKE